MIIVPVGSAWPPRTPGRVGVGRRAYLVMILLMLFALCVCCPKAGFVRLLAYEGERVYSTWRTRALLSGMSEMRSRNFEIKFEENDRLAAEVVLEVAESARDAVLKDLGVGLKGATLIVLHPSAERMNRWFGWSHGEAAMGAYLGGVIHVLDPAVWVGTEDPVEGVRALVTRGPIVHELTHLIIDLNTRGNCPRWFSEGVAQYEEGRLAGIEPVGQGLIVPPANIADLDCGFGSPNEEAAYQRSYLMVRFLTDRYGHDVLEHIIAGLRDGLDIGRAIERSTGTAVPTIESNWKDWMYECNWPNPGQIVKE